MIYIDFIELSGFKSYKDRCIFKFERSGINCVYGKNGVGKSTILEALNIFFNVKIISANARAYLHKGIKNQVINGYIDIGFFITMDDGILNSLDNIFFEENNKNEHTNLFSLKRTFSLCTKSSDNFFLNQKKIKGNHFFKIVDILKSKVGIIFQNTIINYLIKETDLWMFFERVNQIPYFDLKKNQIIQQIEHLINSKNEFISKERIHLDKKLCEINASYLKIQDHYRMNKEKNLIECILYRALMSEKKKILNILIDQNQFLIAELDKLSTSPHMIDDDQSADTTDLDQKILSENKIIKLIDKKTSQLSRKIVKAGLHQKELQEKLKNLESACKDCQLSDLNTKIDTIKSKIAILKEKISICKAKSFVNNEKLYLTEIDNVVNFIGNLQQKIKSANSICMKINDLNQSLLSIQSEISKSEMNEMRTKLQRLNNDEQRNNLKNKYKLSILKIYSFFIDELSQEIFQTKDIFDIFKKLSNSKSDQNSMYNVLGPLMWHLKCHDSKIAHLATNILGKNLYAIIVNTNEGSIFIQNLKQRNFNFLSLQIISIELLRHFRSKINTTNEKIKKNKTFRCDNNKKCSIQLYEGDVECFDVHSHKAIFFSRLISSRYFIDLELILDHFFDSYIYVDCLETAHRIIEVTNHYNCVLPSGDIINKNSIYKIARNDLFLLNNPINVINEIVKEDMVYDKDKNIDESDFQSLIKKKLSLESGIKKLKFEAEEFDITELNDQLIDSEQYLDFLKRKDEFDDMKEDINELNMMLNQTYEVYNELRNKKNNIINANLNLEEFTNSIDSISFDEIESKKVNLEKISSEILQYKNSIDEFLKDRQKHSIELEVLYKKKKAQQKIMNVDIELSSTSNNIKKSNIENYDKLIADNISKIKETQAKIKDIQLKIDKIQKKTLRTDDKIVEELEKMKISELKTRLVQIQNDSKSIGSVNYKIAENLDQIKYQYDTLLSEYKELEKNGHELQAFVKNLDEIQTKKFEAYLSDVKSLFISFFETITNGQASLDFDIERKKINFCFKFNNTKKEYSDLLSLSGGQKTVISLCLFLAFNVPAGMTSYIFDEIDVALDEQYRSACVNVMKKMNAQFIIISFHSQFLELANKKFLIQNINRSSFLTNVDQQNLDESIQNDHDQIIMKNHTIEIS